VNCRGLHSVCPFFLEGGVGLVPKHGCLLTLAYYAFPIWYKFAERRRNGILTGENRRTREKPVPVPLFPSQIPRWLTRARTQDSAARGRRLTTWAMVRPLRVLNSMSYLITSNQLNKNEGGLQITKKESVQFESSIKVVGSNASTDAD
jgi:hypothetical protein